MASADQQTVEVQKGGDYEGKSATLSDTLRRSSTNNITARAGGGQGSATALTTDCNRVVTVATAADSVKLPAAKSGMQISVKNAAAANSMNVFPATGEVINALAANAAYAVAATKVVVFICFVDGTWDTLLTA